MPLKCAAITRGAFFILRAAPTAPREARYAGTPVRTSGEVPVRAFAISRRSRRRIFLLWRILPARCASPRVPVLRCPLAGWRAIRSRALARRTHPPQPSGAATAQERDWKEQRLACGSVRERSGRLRLFSGAWRPSESPAMNPVAIAEPKRCLIPMTHARETVEVGRTRPTVEGA